MPTRGWALGVWLLCLVGCAVVIVKTKFRTDMGAFLPRSASLAQQVLTEQVSAGAASHLILLGIEGAPPPALAALSEDVATRLRKNTAFIDVLNGDEPSFAAAQDFIWRNRYLLSPDVNAARFTAAGLHAALLGDLGLLGTDLGALLQQSLPADPTDEMLALTRAFGEAGGPRVQNGVWVSPAGDTALLLAHTQAPGFDIDAQQRDLQSVEAAFRSARANVPGAAGATLRESGPGVFAVRTRDTTRRDVTRLSILASAGAVGLLAFAYRSPLVLVLGILPVVTGAIAAIAAVSLAFGFVHGVTLGFGVTLIGESIDYAIYLFTQTGQGEAVPETLARIWPTLRLGVLTSVVGFSAMLFSNFTGFAQLGLFSIAGLIAAAATTRLVLPRLVPAGFFGAGAGALARPLLALMRHKGRLRIAAAFAVLAGGVLLATHRGPFWDQNLADLSPIPADQQALDQSLRHDLGVPDFRYFLVYEGADEQSALAESQALGGTLAGLVAGHHIGGFDVPSSILPTAATQAARRAGLPAATVLAANLKQAAAGLPFRADAFGPFLRDAARARAAPLITPDNLPPALALRLGGMLVRRNGRWDVVVPLREVVDPKSVAAVVGAAGPAGVAFVDLNRQSDQLLARFQHEAVTLAVIGSFAILAVLAIGLRAPRQVAMVAAPLAAAVLVTAALLTMDGAKISIFEVVGFLLIVAVGSNYCLFFAREAASEAALARAVASIVLANLCTVSAYGLMSFSAIPVLHEIGRTVALGTFLSLLFAAILSPRGVAEGV